MAGKCLTVLVTLMFSLSVWASTPPPPVNQNLGMPDGVFNSMTMDVCGGCHFNPETAPAPVKEGYLPDRHHLRVDTPIGEYSASPYPEQSPDGTHKCITCHAVDWVDDPNHPDGGYFKFALDPTQAEFRNCLRCHQQKPGIASVHHLTARAQATECNACHGSLINDPNGEVWQIRVMPSMSPNPGFGDGEFGETGHRAGGCRYCHNGGTDDVSGRVVPGPNANMMTHHGTGLGQPNSGTVHGCDLCHDANPPDHTLQGCVRCHAPTSLHSIQADSDGNGTAGEYEEQPYFGHIGTSTDCMGCHMGGTNTPASVMRAAADEPLFKPLLPELDGLSTAKIIAGSSYTLGLSGSGFLVASQQNDVATRVLVESADDGGVALELVPENVTFTSMEVALPATLPAGNYHVKAVNGDMASPPLNLVVSPAVVIDSLTCQDGTVTITGAGFSRHLDAVGSGTGLYDLEDGEWCRIESWNEGRIVADCGSSVDGSVRVDSVFGSVTGKVSGCESAGRPRWWQIWSWWTEWGWAKR